SGCPSVTDSDVNKCLPLFTLYLRGIFVSTQRSMIAQLMHGDGNFCRSVSTAPESRGCKSASLKYSRDPASSAPRANRLRGPADAWQRNASGHGVKYS